MLDAVIQTSTAHSFAELSLAPACERQSPSLYKALEEVSYDLQALNEECLEQVPTDQVAHFAIDVTNVRRMCPPSLKQRQYCHGAAREVAGRGVIIGLPYSIVAWESQRGSSFSPPVNIERIEPGGRRPPLPRGKAPGWPAGRKSPPERFKLAPKAQKKAFQMSKIE